MFKKSCFSYLFLNYYASVFFHPLVGKFIIYWETNFGGHHNPYICRIFVYGHSPTQRRVVIVLKN